MTAAPGIRTGALAIVTGLFLLALPAVGATRMPVPDGAYCGPENAVITIDSGSDTVAIAGYTCAVPVFAADQLQSIQCRRSPDDSPQRREFDVRVLDGAFIYNGRWFGPCPR